MTTRTIAPSGAPCWAGLGTSDVEGSRRFYGELLGWEALEPNPDFGGYFLFEHAGVPVAGIMDAATFAAAGSPAWSVSWEVEDVDAAVATVRSLGGWVAQGAADTPSGRMAAVTDPCGAAFKLRQGRAA